MGEKMRRQTGLTFGGVVALLLSSAVLAEDFSGRLGRIPVDNRTQSTVAGLGHATAELDGSRLTIDGEFGGLLGPATVANLHMGAAVGVRGPAIHELTVSSGIEGELSGSFRLRADEVAALRAGRLYIQIHSQSAPDGNLWGWLFND
jgi:hypothetical protein